MTPRWKFVLYAALGLLGMGFFFFLAIFTFSLVIFVLSKYGFLHLPFFEFMGALHALNVIPVVLLVVTILLLAIIELISRSYSFSFRRPLGVTLLAVTSLAILVSFGISMTNVHEYVRDYARDHRLGFVSQAYDRPVPLKQRNGITAIRGMVIATTSSSVSLKLFDGNTFVGFSSTTSIFSSSLMLGADVVMFGTFMGDNFTIQEIREAPRQPFKRASNKKEGNGPRNEINRPLMR